MKSNNAKKVTGADAATKAAKILRNSKSTPAQRTVAGSDLAQKPGKKSGRR